MIINGEETLIINNEEFWTVRQFSNLTDFTEPRVRSLIYYGNCIRKLEVFYPCSNKPLIPAKELFEFPFVLSGRPLKEYENSLKVKRFYLNEENVLSSREEIIER